MIRVPQGLEMFFMLKQYRIVCQVTNVVLSLDVTAVIDQQARRRDTKAAAKSKFLQKDELRHINLYRWEIY
jgi:hypothetical protein